MLKIVFSSSDLLLLKDEKISIEEYKEKNKIIDLQKEFKLQDQSSAYDVCHVLLKKSLKKDINIILSRWESKNLTKEQIEYSALDSYFLIDCYHKINEFKY